MGVESFLNFTPPARQRWESIPTDIRQRLLSNVWCGQCRHETTIINFSGAIKAATCCWWASAPNAMVTWHG
ncbi:MAG: hypothetical protein WBC62_03410 [Candidatus Macondimonas sp.]